jgi:hypothetical protein
MEFLNKLFGILVIVLLVSVIGLALRPTIVEKMCEIGAQYSVTYYNGTAEQTDTFDASGIDCDTNGLIYTWGLILVALSSVIGLIYTGVKMIKA